MVEYDAKHKASIEAEEKRLVFAPSHTPNFTEEKSQAFDPSHTLNLYPCRFS